MITKTFTALVTVRVPERDAFAEDTGRIPRALAVRFTEALEECGFHITDVAVNVMHGNKLDTSDTEAYVVMDMHKYFRRGE